jgi:hypothetical protein
MNSCRTGSLRMVFVTEDEIVIHTATLGLYRLGPRLQQHDRSIQPSGLFL